MMVISGSGLLTTAVCLRRPRPLPEMIARDLATYRGAGPGRARGVFGVDRLTLVFADAVFLRAPVFFAVAELFAAARSLPAPFAALALDDADLATLRPRFLPLSRCAESSGNASGKEKVVGSALRGSEAITPSWLT